MSRSAGPENPAVTPRGAFSFEHGVEGGGVTNLALGRGYMVALGPGQSASVWLCRRGLYPFNHDYNGI